MHFPGLMSYLPHLRLPISTPWRILESPQYQSIIFNTGTGHWKPPPIGLQVTRSSNILVQECTYHAFRLSGYSEVLSVIEWWTWDVEDVLDDTASNLLPAIVLLSSIPIVDASGVSTSWTSFNPSLVEIVDLDVQNMDNTLWGGFLSLLDR